MTLAVSSVKRGNPFWRMLVFTLKKNLPILIMGSMLSLLIMPIFPITSGFRDGQYESYSAVSSAITGGLVIDWMLAMLMVAVLSIMNFGFLHQKSSSDLFHALPITRKTLYLSRLTATFIGAMVPPTLSSGLGSLLPLWYGAELEVSAISFLYYFGVCLLSVAAVSIFVSLFMLFTGHTFDAVVAFCGINLGLPLLVSVVVAYADANLFGATNLELFLTDVMEFSPVGAFASLMAYIVSNLDATADYTGYSPLGVILWSIIAVGVFVLCLAFSKKRRSEKAGEAYAHPLLPVLLQLLIAILVAFGMGEIFSIFSSFTLVYYIFAVVGALFAAVLLGMIIRRSFRGIKKDLLLGGSAALLVILFGISIMTGFFGYETRVPKVADIEQAQFSYNYGVEELSDSRFTTEADLQKLIALHEAIIDETGPAYYSLFTGKRYQNELDDAYDTDGNYANLAVTYTLKNGSTLKRSYHFYDSAVEEEIAAVLNSENYMNRYTVTQTVAGVHPTTIEYYTTDDIWESVSAPSITLEQAEQILSAYREDVKSGVSGTIAFYLKAEDILVFDQQEATRSAVYPRDRMSLALNSSFLNTIAVLEDCGFDLTDVLNAEPPVK